MKTREIAEFLSGELIGNGDAEIERVGAVANAVAGEIAFIERAGSQMSPTASCFIVPEHFNGKTAAPQIRVSNPKVAFALIAKKLKKYEQRYFGKENVAVAATADIRTSEIGSFVTIGDGSFIGEGCEIGDGVRIGKNVLIKKFTVLHPNSVICDNVQIGSHCVIHSGTVVGAEGFGYVRDENGDYHQFPQIGRVVIEDNVEIGANSCIDRGSLDETRIGEGTKIDNLVQIAHNVRIGKRVVIAAQTGISGSTVIEDDVVIAGQVGIADHVTVRKGATIGAKSAVFPGKIVGPGVWVGTPVQPIADYKRQHSHLRSLERLKADVKELKKKT